MFFGYQIRKKPSPFRLKIFHLGVCGFVLSLTEIRNKNC